jgi:hypothetical protein
MAVASCKPSSRSEWALAPDTCASTSSFAETARKAWDEGYDRAVATHCDADDCDISGANPYTETAGE